VHPRVRLGTGFVFLLGGLFLLAFTQVARVFIDPRRLELGGVSSDTVGNLAYVFLSAILLMIGFTTLLSVVSPAKGARRAISLIGLFSSGFLLLMFHLTLFINSLTFGTESDVTTYFTASYLFHTGDRYSVMAVFLILLVTLTLLAAFVSSIATLLAPGRFHRALWDPADWDKNEATLVSSSLLLVFALTLFLVYLVQVSVGLSEDPLPAQSFFANVLPVFYYLQIFFVGGLILTIGARVFLVNWGTQLPLAADTVMDSLHNAGRVERVFAVAAVVFNILILTAPPATDVGGLSTDPVFLLDSRGLAWFFFLLAAPYLPYLVSHQRLRRLLDDGKMRPSGSPFSQQSLRLVLVSLGGLVLLTAVGLGANLSPLGVMIALTAWMTLVLLWASVSFKLERGSFAPHLRNSASPPYFFGFILLAVCLGLMMWGAGNTYVATYTESAKQIQVENASPYGAELLYRIGGATMLALSVMLPLSVVKNARGVRRSLLVPHVVTFSALILLGTIVFSVNVWNTSESDGDDAVAGFAFHQYYLEEKLMVAALVLILSAALLWSLGRSVGMVVRARPYAQVVKAIQVR